LILIYIEYYLLYPELIYFSRIELTNNENNYFNYIFIGSAPINSKSKKYRLQFDIDSIPEQDQVKAAEVRLTMLNDTVLRNEEFIHVMIHDIVQPGMKGLSKPILR